MNYDASETSTEGGSVCAWDVALEIRGEPFPNTSICRVSMRVVSSVEQSVVLPATSSGEPSECVAENAILDVIHPASTTQTAPSLGEDYTFPIRLRPVDTSPPPSEGAYFGDTSVIVPWLRPFAGFGFVEALAFDAEGTVSLEPRSSVLDGALVSGQFERVPR